MAEKKEKAEESKEESAAGGQTGTVKNWLTSYGFITGDDGKEYFVHVSDLKSGDSLSSGQKVEFSVEEGPKGLKAKNVKAV